MHSEEQRTQVQGCLMAVRREELEVAADALLAHLYEHFLGGAGHAEIIGGALHAAGVLLGAEDDDLAVLLGEGLEAFETGDSVRVDLRLDDGTCTVSVKSQGIPINLGHDMESLIVKSQ